MTPEIIRETIKKAGLTRQQAADLLGVSKRAVDAWLTNQPAVNHRKMPQAAWELLLIKTAKARKKQIDTHKKTVLE